MGLNIGGNNAAAAMGAAYGAKVRTKYQAVLLIGVFSLLGAIFSGGEVIKTLGSGILPSGTILLNGAIIAVAAAGITVFLANILRIPISTSQAAVGSVVQHRALRRAAVAMDSDSFVGDCALSASRTSRDRIHDGRYTARTSSAAGNRRRGIYGGIHVHLRDAVELGSFISGC